MKVLLIVITLLGTTFSFASNCPHGVYLDSDLEAKNSANLKCGNNERFQVIFDNSEIQIDLLAKAMLHDNDFVRARMNNDQEAQFTEILLDKDLNRYILIYND